MEFAGRSAATWRAFATFERGRPLAYALLLDASPDGMLEDVFTTPEARGRGLASAVCAAPEDFSVTVTSTQPASDSPSSSA